MIYLLIGTLLVIGATSQDLTCGTNPIPCDESIGQTMCVDYQGIPDATCGYCKVPDDCNSNSFWTTLYGGQTNLQCRDPNDAGIDGCYPPACDIDVADSCSTGEVCVNSTIGGLCIDPTVNIPSFNITTNFTIPDFNISIPNFNDTNKGCTANKDCSWSFSSPICAYGECVACMETSDCVNNTFWYGEGYTCESNWCNYESVPDCTTNDECKNMYGDWAPVCTDSGSCVACMEPEDCTSNDYYGAGYECTEWYTCDMTCSSNEDCEGNAWYPVCNQTTGECVACETTPYCKNNKYYGDGYSCVNAGRWSYCDRASEECEPIGGDTYCKSTFSSDYTCQEHPFSPGYYYCSDEQSPICDITDVSACLDYEPDSDSDDGFAGIFDWGCDSVIVPINISGNVTLWPMNVCLPQSQCTIGGDECPIGAECIENDVEGIFSFNMCQLSNNTCTDGGNECAAIDDELACYVPEGRCYLPCDPEKLNEDCDTDLGWYCSTPGNNTWGCLPVFFDNITRVETNPPTASPTAEPKLDEAGASQLAIFGGMIIMMIKYVVFM